MKDQQMALSLLMELAIQRGSLSHMLGVVLLLLNLWNSSHHDRDNRLSSSLSAAPLLPLLTRLQDVQPSKKAGDMSHWDEVWDNGRIEV